MGPVKRSKVAKEDTAEDLVKMEEMEVTQYSIILKDMLQLAPKGFLNLEILDLEVLADYV